MVPRFRIVNVGSENRVVFAKEDSKQMVNYYPAYYRWDYCGRFIAPVNPNLLYWPDKDPDEVLDYKINWSKRLNGDAIVSSTLEAEGTPSIVIDETSFDTKSATVWLSGGVDGETVQFLNRIETLGGRTMDQTIYININSK